MCCKYTVDSIIYQVKRQVLMLLIVKAYLTREGPRLRPTQQHGSDDTLRSGEKSVNYKRAFNN